MESNESGIGISVTILGTSSATPTRKRGLSGTILIRDGETFLFDCGEGTQFKLIEAGVPRRKFRHIFISHLHGDHIFGLGGLISTLNLGGREIPLHVHGPRGIKRFIDFMISFPRPTRLKFPLHVHDLVPNHEGIVWEEEDWVVSSMPLDHTLPALGYRFQERDRPGFFDDAKAESLGVPFGPERGRLIRGEAITLVNGSIVQPEEVVGPPRRGKSVVYCTDTAYCERSIELARDADLLIHEATYADEDREMARDRKHSTIREAATVAKLAGVRKFVATHFSTRYEGGLLKQLKHEGREVFPDLIMAKDLIQIDL
jgi:ribonuclease Z